MSFQENLIKLRKEMGMSQEALAEKLEVSRQTIYKWETGQNYPEMDRLVMLSELFNCSIDDLIKSEVNTTNIVQKDKYEKFYNKFAKNISLGVGLIIFGIASMLLLFEFFESQFLIPLITFFVFLCISVMIFIINGIDFNQVSNKFLKGSNFYSEEEVHLFTKKFAVAIAAGVALIILSIVSVIVLHQVVKFANFWPSAVMLYIIAIAVFILVYFGIMYSKYHMNFIPKEENAAASKISSVVMILATVIYLIIGFGFGLWHPGWIVFPIGGLLCGITSVIFPPKENK